MGQLGWYLDASLLVALLTPEPHSEKAIDFVANNKDLLSVSDLGSAEFASAIARRVRMGEVTIEDARRDLAGFDAWMQRSPQRVEIAAVDVVVATGYLRRLDLPLRTPDAIHIAIAQRLGATLVTFDRQMAASAEALGAAVAMP